MAGRYDRKVLENLASESNLTLVYIRPIFRQTLAAPTLSRTLAILASPHLHGKPTP
jgi:hypothetical protein